MKHQRQIEELVAELVPRPDAPAVMRKLPERLGKAQPKPSLSPASDGVAPSVELLPDGAAVSLPQLRPDAVASPAPASVPAAVVQPLAPARYKVQFTASTELHHKRERLRALMRSLVPDGDLAAIIEQAVTEKLTRPGHSSSPPAPADETGMRVSLRLHTWKDGESRR